MKQVPTQFGQARQLAEMRQQVASLQEQVKKLTDDIKTLRDLDRKIFDDQDKEVVNLKELAKEYYAVTSIMLAIDDPTYEEIKDSELRLEALQKRTEDLLKLNEEQ